METVNQKKTTIVEKTPNWWDKEYLFHACGSQFIKQGSIYDNKTLPKAVYDFVPGLGNDIIRSKKFYIISDYFQYYSEVTDGYLGSDIEIKTPNDKVISLPGFEFGRFYSQINLALLIFVCNYKGKLLLGTKNKQPLWADIPINWNRLEFTGGHWGFDSVYGLFFLKLLSLLTGSQPQQAYDRLILPNGNKWANRSKLSRSNIIELETTVAEHLGFPNGFISEDEYLQILSDAFLSQKYVLVEDRPVLVRLEEHPSIYQVILIKKGNILLARIDTFTNGQFLHMQKLDESSCDDILWSIKGMLVYKENNIDFEEQELNYIFPSLIATIYRDLVTVEEKEIGTRRVAGKHKPDLKTKKVDPLEPKLYTTSWQYIPRRQYIYNRPNDESYMDREPLSEADQHRQHAIRKWHMVCGHIRRYRDKADWMASGDKQDQALADGIILRIGETYVKPHARGLNALEELGEIDINSIPHYMRRKMG
jgi:hypothetical protein